MNNTSFSFPRYAVFAFAFVIAEALFMLSFTQHIDTLLLAVLLFSLVIFVFFLLYKNVVLAIFMCVVISLGAILPHYAYHSKEEYSLNLISNLSQEEHYYSGTVTHSSGDVHVANSRILVNAIDGIPLKKPFKAGVTNFSGKGEEQNDSVVIKGIASGLANTEPAEFDTKSYLKGKNTFVVLDNAQTIFTSSNRNNNIFLPLKHYFEDTIFKYVHNNTEIVKALALGDRSEFSTDMTESFSKSGMSHLMCISGMHLSIILGMIYSLLSFLTVNKKLRCVLLICFCAFYIMFTGASLSVVRAGIMSIFTYVAMLFGRKSDSVIALFLAGALMVFVNPYVVFDISARLSFSATFGVILLSKITGASFSGLSYRHPFFFGILSTVATNVGAVAFTTPIGADYFGSFSTVSILSTFCSSFACEVLLILSNILCFLSVFPFTSAICSFVGNICSFLAKFIMDISDYFSSFRFSYVQASNTQYVLIIFIVLVCVLALAIAVGCSKATKISVAMIVSLSLVFSVVCIREAIIKHNSLAVSYFRQNEDDRQLGVKFGSFGHIIFNNDSILCSNPKSAMFDDISGNNYVIILPDESISLNVLETSIRIFDSDYSIKCVLVPYTDSGKHLSDELLNRGIDCKMFLGTLKYDNLSLTLSNPRNNTYHINIKDKDQEIFIVYSDKYVPEDFAGHSDICAYFTRKTKTQFSPDNDTPPSCNTFFTRTKKDYTSDNLINTFGKKSFMIKE